MTTLKQLRMWHWRQYLELHRQSARTPRMGEVAALHLSAVEVLNASLPGTAADDCADELRTIPPGNYVFTSGHRDALRADLGNRRFFVVPPGDAELVRNARCMVVSILPPDDLMTVAGSNAAPVGMVQMSLGRCAADRDGDCIHHQCPQLRDGEPVKSGRHCPLDNPTKD